MAKKRESRGLTRDQRLIERCAAAARAELQIIAVAAGEKENLEGFSIDLIRANINSIEGAMAREVKRVGAQQQLPTEES